MLPTFLPGGLFPPAHRPPHGPFALARDNAILGGAGVAPHLTSLWPVCFSSSAAIVSASSGLVAKSSKPISLHRARVSWLRTAHGCGWVRVGGVRVWVRVGVRVGFGLGLGLELGLRLSWGAGVRASSSKQGGPAVSGDGDDWHVHSHLLDGHRGAEAVHDVHAQVHQHERVQPGLGEHELLERLQGVGVITR